MNKIKFICIVVLAVILCLLGVASAENIQPAEGVAVKQVVEVQITYLQQNADRLKDLTRKLKVRAEPARTMAWGTCKNDPTFICVYTPGKQRAYEHARHPRRGVKSVEFVLDRAGT